MIRYILFLAALVPAIYFAQTPGEWTWMNGSTTSGVPVYGTQGVPSSANSPGNCYEGKTWVDQQGNFWLYGGLDLGSFLQTNDMWRFNPTTNQWTWMNGSGVPGFITPNFGVQGVPAASNNPGECYLGSACTWIDQTGNLWMLITDFMFSSNCSTWRYDIATNMWTWVHGNFPADYGTLGVPAATNNPAIFGETPVYWKDTEGDFWFFDGYNGGVMWEYDIATNMWTWMNGTPGGTAVIGPQGVFNTTNQPGSSWTYTNWTHQDGTFYMFGQSDFMNGQERSIMWKFDPAINQWAWVAGSSTSGGPSTFSGECNFAPGNLPLSSMENTAEWEDECGKFWAYNETEGYLWCFDPAINQFALVEGDLTPSNAVYGTMGVSNATTHPGQSFGSPSWKDQNGYLWKLGSTDNLVYNSAMMRYVIDPQCIASSATVNISATPITGCVPLDVQFDASINTPTLTYHWDFGVPGIDDDTSNVADPLYTYTTTGTFTAQLIVHGSSGCGTTDDTLTTTITVGNPPVVTVNDASVCAGQTATLTANGATTYSWSPAAGLNTTTGPTVQASPAVTTNYIVTGTTNGCSATDTATVTILASPQITVNDVSICPQDSVTLTASGADTYTWSPATTLSSSTGSSVIAFPTVTTTYTITGTDTTTQCSSSDQATVTIENVQVTVNSGTICGNDPNSSVTLVANGAATYSWSPSSGLSSTSGSTVTATPSQTTTYTVVGYSANNCTDTAYATVTVVPDFTVTVNSDSICAGESTLLAANGADSYTWSPGTGLSAITGTEVVASPTVTTIYTVTGSISGCTETATATVIVLPVPVAAIFASPNPASTVEPVVTLSTISGYSSQNWYMDNALISQLQSFTQTFPAEPGQYVVQLIVNNDLGCSDTGYVTIVINEDIIFFVPNSFTPDGNPFNELFVPVITAGIDSKGYEFEIFDRWGERIFHSTKIDEGWDGTYKGQKCQDGTYTWTLKFKSKYNDGIFEHTGHVTLLR